MKTAVTLTEHREDGYACFRLENKYMAVTVCSLGARVLSAEVPDRDGNRADVLLGLADPHDPGEDGAYFGAFVGRVANRIRGAAFDLNGEHFRLTKNAPPHHLHGGFAGFNRKLFRCVPAEDGVTFRCSSPDGEEGYPGNLDAEITYTLHGSAFTAAIRAVSDADTLFAPTCHLYFNLGGSLWEHTLTIAAEEYLPVDGDCLVCGRTLSGGGDLL